MTAGNDPTQFRVSVVRSDNHAVVRVAGELDCSTAPALEATLEDLLVTDRPSLLVVEAGQLTFADVVGLGVIIDAAERLAPTGRLRVRDAGRQLVRVLDLLGHSHLVDAG